MKTRQAKLSFIIAVLLISFSGVQTADAGIRVSAKIRTPQIGIHVTNGPVAHFQVSNRRAPLPVRKHLRYRVHKEDRKVAQRLARYTGVSKRELLRLRSQGYRWSEIGRWLDLPRTTVRAARDSQSWKRFLKQERRLARRHQGRHDRYDERHVCYD